MRNSNSKRGEVLASVFITLMIIAVILSVPHVWKKLNYSKILDCKVVDCRHIDSTGTPLPKPRP